MTVWPQHVDYPKYLDPVTTSAIDIVEAAYDLEAGAADWAPRLLEAGKCVFDLGLGVSGGLVSGAAPDGQPLVTQMLQGTAGPGVLVGLMQAAQKVGPDLIAQTTEAMAGTVVVLSEHRERWPKVFDEITKHVGSKDVFGLWALDPDTHGIQITMPSPELIELSPKARQHWQMLAVHIAAGHRLRRKLAEPVEIEGTPFSEIPLNAEALIDPTRFLVSEAAGSAKDRSVSEKIREAAVRVDRARGKLRKSAPDAALAAWHGLVRGRWSLVDWFDTDGRRFVLAKPNAPNLGDPRGLTEREHQVATYAARGESNKLIGYRFGISAQRVSALLHAAMLKLNVKTPAQLVERMRGLPTEPEGEPRP